VVGRSPSTQNYLKNKLKQKSSRALAQQIQGPEFKLQHCQKNKESTFSSKSKEKAASKESNVPDTREISRPC
jgi:hypothetical protein